MAALYGLKPVAFAIEGAAGGGPPKPAPLSDFHNLSGANFRHVICSVERSLHDKQALCPGKIHARNEHLTGSDFAGVARSGGV